MFFRAHGRRRRGHRAKTKHAKKEGPCCLQSLTEKQNSHQPKYDQIYVYSYNPWDPPLALGTLRSRGHLLNSLKSQLPPKNLSITIHYQAGKVIPGSVTEWVCSPRRGLHFLCSFLHITKKAWYSEEIFTLYAKGYPLLSVVLLHILPLRIMFTP